MENLNKISFCIIHTHTHKHIAGLKGNAGISLGHILGQWSEQGFVGRYFDGAAAEDGVFRGADCAAVCHL
jgi:hypothetical protein